MSVAGYHPETNAGIWDRLRKTGPGPTHVSSSETAVQQRHGRVPPPSALRPGSAPIQHRHGRVSSPSALRFGLVASCCGSAAASSPVLSGAAEQQGTDQHFLFPVFFLEPVQPLLEPAGLLRRRIVLMVEFVFFYAAPDPGFESFANKRRSIHHNQPTAVDITADIFSLVSAIEVAEQKLRLNEIFW